MTDDTALEKLIVLDALTTPSLIIILYVSAMKVMVVQTVVLSRVALRTVRIVLTRRHVSTEMVMLN